MHKRERSGDATLPPELRETVTRLVKEGIAEATPARDAAATASTQRMTAPWQVQSPPVAGAAVPVERRSEVRNVDSVTTTLPPVVSVPLGEPGSASAPAEMQAAMSALEAEAPLVPTLDETVAEAASDEVTSTSEATTPKTKTAAPARKDKRSKRRGAAKPKRGQRAKAETTPTAEALQLPETDATELQTPNVPEVEPVVVAAPPAPESVEEIELPVAMTPEAVEAEAEVVEPEAVEPIAEDEPVALEPEAIEPAVEPAVVEPEAIVPAATTPEAIEAEVEPEAITPEAEVEPAVVAPIAEAVKPAPVALELEQMPELKDAELGAPAQPEPAPKAATKPTEQNSREAAAERKRRAKARARKQREAERQSTPTDGDKPGKDRRRRLFARGRTADADAAIEPTPAQAEADARTPELSEPRAPMAFPGDDPAIAMPAAEMSISTPELPARSTAWDPFGEPTALEEEPAPLQERAPAASVAPAPSLFDQDDEWLVEETAVEAPAAAAPAPFSPQPRVAADSATQAAWEIGRLPILLHAQARPVELVAMVDTSDIAPATWLEADATDHIARFAPTSVPPAPRYAYVPREHVAVKPEPPRAARKLPTGIARLEQPLFAPSAEPAAASPDRPAVPTETSTPREPGDSRRLVAERRAELEDLVSSLSSLAGRSSD